MRTDPSQTASLSGSRSAKHIAWAGIPKGTAWLFIIESGGVGGVQRAAAAEEDGFGPLGQLRRGVDAGE